MASLFKHQDKYYLSFYDKTKRPLRKQVSLKTSNKKLANTLRTRLESSYLLGTYCPWGTIKPKEEVPAPPMLGEAVTSFLASRSNLRYSSLKKYKDVLRLFENFIGSDRIITEITSSDVSAFLSSTARKPITKKTYSKGISPLFNWAGTRYSFKHNPVSGIVLGRVPSKFPKYFTREELDHIIAIMNTGGAEWLSFPTRANVYLGLRLSELIHVKWEHIDLNKPNKIFKNSVIYSPSFTCPEYSS